MNPDQNRVLGTEFTVTEDHLHEPGFVQSITAENRDYQVRLMCYGDHGGQDEDEPGQSMLTVICKPKRPVPKLMWTRREIMVANEFPAVFTTKTGCIDSVDTAILQLKTAMESAKSLNDLVAKYFA